MWVSHVFDSELDLKFKENIQNQVWNYEMTGYLQILFKSLNWAEIEVKVKVAWG